MADKRVFNLDTLTEAQLAALITTVKFIVDDPTFTEAKALKLSDFLKSNTIETMDGTNVSKAVTPAAFYNTVMTETRRGVGTFADDTAINTKTGDSLLRSSKQSVMQGQWQKDWWTKNGSPVIYNRTADDMTAGGAIAYQTVYAGNLAKGEYVDLSPTLQTGALIDLLHITFVLSSNTHAEKGSFIFPFSTAYRYQAAGTAGNFAIWAESTALIFVAQSQQNNLRISCLVNATLK